MIVSLLLSSRLHLWNSKTKKESACKRLHCRGTLESLLTKLSALMWWTFSRVFLSFPQITRQWRISFYWCQVERFAKVVLPLVICTRNRHWYCYFILSCHIVAKHTHTHIHKYICLYIPSSKCRYVRIKHENSTVPSMTWVYSRFHTVVTLPWPQEQGLGHRRLDA